MHAPFAGHGHLCADRVRNCFAQRVLLLSEQGSRREYSLAMPPRYGHRGPRGRRSLSGLALKRSLTVCFLHAAASR